jgi:hypothetical protein
VMVLSQPDPGSTPNSFLSSIILLGATPLELAAPLSILL